MTEPNSSKAVPEKLAQEFISFSNKCDLKKDLLYGDELDDDLCISLLRKAASTILTMKSEIAQKRRYFVNTSEEELEEIRRDVWDAKLTTEEDLKLAKSKVNQLIESNRQQKLFNIQATQEIKAKSKHIKALSAHIERLMTYLKLEATSKQKAISEYAVCFNENKNAERRINTLNKHLESKDRLILSLEEGNRMLEDQLRLMDQKYFQQQAQLSQLKKNQQTVIVKAETVANELRAKYWQEHHKVLDAVVLKEVNSDHATQQSYMKERPKSSIPSHRKSSSATAISSMTAVKATGRLSSTEASQSIYQPDPIITTRKNSDQDLIDGFTMGSMKSHEDKVKKLLEMTSDTQLMYNNNNTVSKSSKQHIQRPKSASNLIMVTRNSNLTKEEKIERAVIKLRRRTGRSAVEKWTVERAKYIAEHDGCFG